MAANDGTGTEEHKKKVSDCFLKPGGHQNISRSPRMCTSAGKDWPESLSNDNAMANDEEKDLNRCLASSAGSGAPSKSFCPMTDAEFIGKELTVRNYKNPNLAFVSYQHNYRQSQKNQLGNESKYKSLSGEIVPQDEEQTPFRLNKEVRGIDSSVWSLKSFSREKATYGLTKVSACTSNGDKITTSSNALLLGRTLKNASNTYSFPQLLVNQTLKGKGIMCKDADKSIEPGGAPMSQEDETPTFVTEFHSDTLMRSNADGNYPSLQKIVKSDTKSFDDGINLREWLNSSGHKINKSGRLCIFKQILEYTDFAHSQGVVLQDLRPSCFTLLPSSKVKYIGSSGQGELDHVMTCNVTKKRPLEQDMCSYHSLGAKQQQLYKEPRSPWQQHPSNFIHGCRTAKVNEIDCDTSGAMKLRNTENVCQNQFSCQHSFIEEKQFISVTVHMEQKWYSSPEELNNEGCTFTANIYSLGVLLFELLCNIESWEVRSAAMLDLHHRILPPRFLAENPQEAGFCLWLLHPEPASRPNTRMILESELIRESEELNSGDDVSVPDDDEAETEQLLRFLISLREEKLKQTAKLSDELSCLDEDIKEVERRYSPGTASAFSLAEKDFPELRENSFHLQDPCNSDVCKSNSESCVNEPTWMKNISQLENAYFSKRSQILLTEAAAVVSCDKDILKSRWSLSHEQYVNEEQRSVQRSVDCLGPFFEGLCKFSRYSKFKECGTLRDKDLLNSANVICALSFDRDEDYIAAAGVSKKIKIFDFSAILSDSIDVQYPIVEMSNKSKLSCVCWNSYIKNHLASTDYEGVVQMWDAGTGKPISQYTEHQKRAWSVHFSQSDPKMFASGSDDCSVKLWNISERSSLSTIWSRANVCCVQFSAYSPHLLVFGSADYKIYGYDLRHTRIPWCTLAGHGKAVSYVKFLDSETLASASTDNSLKLWDLKKTSSSGLSSGACDLTFKGHSNEKNFVGLSVLDGYIACGSETNEVYCYHRSLPMPITSHKFGSADCISGRANNDDNNGQFVSSVCWRKKCNRLVAANSIGVVKLLKMVKQEKEN